MGQGNEIIVRIDSLAKVTHVIGVIDRLEIFDAGGLRRVARLGRLLERYQAEETLMIISDAPG